MLTNKKHSRIFLFYCPNCVIHWSVKGLRRNALSWSGSLWNYLRCYDCLFILWNTLRVHAGPIWTTRQTVLFPSLAWKLICAHNATGKRCISCSLLLQQLSLQSTRRMACNNLDQMSRAETRRVRPHPTRFRVLDDLAWHFRYSGGDLFRSQSIRHWQIQIIQSNRCWCNNTENNYHGWRLAAVPLPWDGTP